MSRAGLYRGVIFAGLALALAFALVFPFNNHASGPQLDSELAPRTQDEEQIIRVYRNASDAVVFISTVTLTIDPFEVFPEIKRRDGMGSGFIVDDQRGLVLTNLHVIEQASSAEGVSIMLAGGRRHAAKVVGWDKECDIALLQLRDPPARMVSLKFGDSSRLVVGQRVLAIGNPFGLDRTLTTGIISSLNRTIQAPSGSMMTGLIQTDASINPGNSGGPLLDTKGRLIGVNSTILSQSGDSAGIGFAVPINKIARILPELIATGKVLRPDLGWVLVDSDQGPMVRRVMVPGPAAMAGVQPVERPLVSLFNEGFVQDIERADLIAAVNGRRVRNRQEVEDYILESDPERPVILTLLRGGDPRQSRDVSIKPVWR